MRIAVAFTLITFAGFAILPLLLIVAITGAMAKFADWLIADPYEI